MFAYSGVQHIFFFSSSCVLYVASFSGLSFFDCSFGILVYYQFKSWSMLLIFLVFCVVPLCVFTFWVPCCDIRYDLHIKRCSVRIYLQLFVRGLMSYLHYLCLIARSVVQHMLYCVFVLIFIALCVLCFQFLWNVHFWLPLWYSLTFIWFTSILPAFMKKIICISLYYC